MYCRREKRSFPDSDFVIDPRWGWVHVTLSPQHTVRGTVLGSSGKPGVKVSDPLMVSAGKRNSVPDPPAEIS